MLISVDSGYLNWPHLPTRLFDHCIVAVEATEEGEEFTFFDPTAESVPVGWLPAALEGALGLVVAAGADTGLVRLPVSCSDDNLASFQAELALEPDLRARGVVEETYVGHPAFEIRNWLRSLSIESARAGYETQLENEHRGARVTDLDVGGVAELGDTVRVRDAVEFPKLGRTIGGRLVLQPDFLTANPTPTFDSEERNHAIVYGYAGKSVTRIAVELPPGTALDRPPDPIEFENAVGRYHRAVAVKAGVLVFERTAERAFARLGVDRYGEVRAWDRTRASGDREQVVLELP